MKQKNRPRVDEPVTRQHFDVTIKGLDARFEALIKAFHNEMSFMAESIIDRVEKRIAESTSRVLSVIDPFLKELETSRQERTISSEQITKVQDTIDHHEKRITKLEKTQQTN